MFDTFVLTDLLLEANLAGVRTTSFHVYITIVIITGDLICLFVLTYCLWCRKLLSVWVSIIGCIALRLEIELKPKLKCSSALWILSVLKYDRIICIIEKKGLWMKITVMWVVVIGKMKVHWKIFVTIIVLGCPLKDSCVNLRICKGMLSYEHYRPLIWNCNFHMNIIKGWEGGLKVKGLIICCY